MTELRSEEKGGRLGFGGRTLGLMVLAVSGVFLAWPAAAQGTDAAAPVPAPVDTVTVVPGPGYEAGGLRTAFLGKGWRSLWTTPVDAPVFEFDRHAGGVEWERRGGGNQSITLHLKATDDWREYIFRSVNKFPYQGLPDPLVGTPMSWLVQDLISALLPAAPLIVPPFLDAVDILHVDPVLRIMPDDSRLEIYQDTFAGMLGTVEIKANEAPDDRPGYAGAAKIKGTDEFFNDLEESKDHRLDEREFLKARLVDFLINDPDRTFDNMRWARFGEAGDYRWRPLPVDRDWAFVNGRGWLAPLIRGIYPKFVAFGNDYPSVEGLAFSSHILDRRLLQRLTREDFAATADQVRAAITDDVVETALARMPERWQDETTAPEEIRTALQHRRTGLRDMALRFYDHLATDVEIYGTEEADLAVIERHGDGRVEVLVTWPEDDPRSGEPFYRRTFLPGETSEVRINLDDGDDLARVVGAANGAIRVRVVGGEGDDTLADEAGAGATHFYDSEGEDRFITAAGTRVSRAEWDPPEPSEGFALGAEWAPSWGGGMGWSPTVDYSDQGGVIVGAGPVWTSYGFRRLPYHWQVGGRLLYATGHTSVGAELFGDLRWENSPFAWTLYARATPFDDFRFNGYGNNSPHAGSAGLVEQDRIAVDPAFTWHIGWRQRPSEGRIVSGRVEDGDEEPRGLQALAGRLDVGPSFRWTDPHPVPGSPLAVSTPLGTGASARGGLRAALTLDRTDRGDVPRRGWRVEANTAAYSPTDAPGDPFAQGDAELRSYFPLIGDGPHLALRAGGRVAAGPVPAQHSPWIGGRTTLRGYRWQRFRGDAAAYGGAELRVPVMPVELLVRWDLGVFGLADAGRAWVKGESPGGWHVGYGGGLWLNTLGQTVSFAYARGEEDRVYLQLGMPF